MHCPECCSSPSSLAACGDDGTAARKGRPRHRSEASPPPSCRSRRARPRRGNRPSTGRSGHPDRRGADVGRCRLRRDLLGPGAVAQRTSPSTTPSPPSSIGGVMFEVTGVVRRRGAGVFYRRKWAPDEVGDERVGAVVLRRDPALVSGEDVDRVELRVHPLLRRGDRGRLAVVEPRRGVRRQPDRAVVELGARAADRVVQPGVCSPSQCSTSSATQRSSAVTL